jgi:predicted nuclease of predicted toxin-antitoxin system
LKLFIDECLSPQLARRLAQAGYVAIHPLDYGRTGELDHQVLQRCLDEDLTIVTENALDFRKLIGKFELHPGLIILPCVDRETSWKLIEAALAYLHSIGDAAKVMVNHVLEVDATGSCSLYPLPAE